MTPEESLELWWRVWLAMRAEEYAGGVSGWTKHHDPEGHFRRVTEGRQMSWTDPNTGKPRSYSACEDLLTRLAWEAAGRPTDGPLWCNRKEAGRAWKPGWNILSLKQHAGFAWKNYGPHARWDIEVGDGVQVSGKYGPHTMVITRLRRAPDGTPVSCDHADYGQFLDPDGAGPEQPDHGCRVFESAPLGRDTLARWTVNRYPVIGRFNLIELATHEGVFGTYEPWAVPP